MTQAAADQPTPMQRKAMRSALMVACGGGLPITIFTNGLLLLVLTSMHISSERIVLYLSLPAIVAALTSVPFAVLSDRYGKKLLGSIGAAGELVSYVLMTAALLTGRPAEWMVAAALTSYTLFLSMISAGWFAMLSPIVPESMRGRFFGRLRVSWQMLTVLFTVGCAAYLSQDTPMPVFAGVFVLITVSQLVRVVFYLRLPEVERVSRQPIALRRVFLQVFRTEGFMPFCAYMFLISLATTAGPILFGLIEKRVLGYGDDLVVWMGNLYMMGAVVGFAAGGWMVDRVGTKPVFLMAHFGYAAVLALFMARSLIPTVIGVHALPVGAANFAYGFVWAFASIAVSTEMLALIPAEHKSLSTSACNTFIRIGASLSGLLTAWLLKVGALSETWTWGGATLSRYDTVLLFCAGGVVLLVVTLGLVPSVIHKAQWAPRQY